MIRRDLVQRHKATHIVLNTLLAACFGGVMGILTGRVIDPVNIPHRPINGSLAGLVAITIGALAHEEWLVSHHEARHDPPLRAALDSLAAVLTDPDLRRGLVTPD